MSTPARRALSHATGWLMDRKVPRFARRFVYGCFARITGADLSEAQLAPEGYASLGQVFVRRLRAGARPFAPEAQGLAAPCDGTLSVVERVTGDALSQIKGQTYSARELVGGAGDDLDLEQALALTVYLSPRDYHRVHCPLGAELERLEWLGGARFSVAPRVLGRTPRIFVRNERVVLRLATAYGPLLVVLVGALNVGRMAVVGVPRGATVVPASAARFAHGDELARFEMGSTVVCLWPRSSTRGLEPVVDPGRSVRAGELLARWTDR